MKEKAIFSNPVFCQRLKVVREEFNLTQSELARLVGVSKNTISNIECDKSIPSCYLAFRLSGVLGVRVDDLFTLL